jgi:hypothetical protein
MINVNRYVEKFNINMGSCASALGDIMKDPFFKDNPPPVFIDEIQYAPNLSRSV